MVFICHPVMKMSGWVLGSEVVDRIWLSFNLMLFALPFCIPEYSFALALLNFSVNFWTFIWILAGTTVCVLLYLYSQLLKFCCVCFIIIFSPSPLPHSLFIYSLVYSLDYSIFLLLFISMFRLSQNRPMAAPLTWLLCLLDAPQHSWSIPYFLALMMFQVNFVFFSALAMKSAGSLSLSQKNPGFLSADI